MSERTVQLLGFALLALCLLVSELGLQRRSPMQGALRQARLLALLAGYGGLIGATAWVQNLPYAFAWALPPLAARFLAAAALAFGLVALRAAWVGVTGHLRMIAAMLLVYLVPLAATLMLFHLDRIDLASPVAWVFLAIVLAMSLSALLAFFRLPFDERGLSSGLLGLVGTLAGLWGAALFLWPAAPIPFLFPWPDDPLTTRLIGAMFLTVATACHYAEGPSERRSADLLCFVYGAGIALACAYAAWQGKTFPWAYLVFWAAVAVVSLKALLSERGAAPAPGPSRRG